MEIWGTDGKKEGMVAILKGPVRRGWRFETLEVQSARGGKLAQTDSL